MPGEVLRPVHIEANENVLQRVRIGEGCGIDQLIIFAVNTQSGGLYLFQRLKSEIPCCVAVFELIDSCLLYTSYAQNCLIEKDTRIAEIISEAIKTNGDNT